MARYSLSDEWGFWISMPEIVIEMMSEIGSDAVLMFMYMRYRTNKRSGKAWPGYERMRQDIGWGKSRIANAINDLEDAKLIERRYRIGATTEYRLTRPPDSTGAGQSESQSETPTVPERDLTQDSVKQDESRTKTETTSSDGKTKNAIRKEFAEDFSQMSGLAIPMPETEAERKTAGKRWWQPIRRMCIEALWDPLVSRRIMNDVLDQMDRDNLTVDAPASIEKNFRATVAALKRGAYKKAGEPKGNQGLRDYLRTKGVPQ